MAPRAGQCPSLGYVNSPLRWHSKAFPLMRGSTPAAMPTGVNGFPQRLQTLLPSATCCHKSCKTWWGTLSFARLKTQNSECYIGRMSGCRRIIPFAALLICVCGSAYAQTQFMTRYDFYISIAGLASEDPRFSWDGRVGGDMDLVDYVTGRTSFFAEYDVVMGNQLRPFDPNQGNYTFEGATSIRAGGTEIAGVFHHYSRHLSDRLKTEAVSVNVVGGRLLRRFTTGKVGIDARADIGKVVQRSFLDYTWRTQLNATARRPITPLVGWFASASMETYRVDRTVALRGAQTSGRIESGIHLNGQRGSLELFGGWEHLMDAYPVERIGRTWAFAGFRLVGN